MAISANTNIYRGWHLPSPPTSCRCQCGGGDVSVRIHGLLCRVRYLAHTRLIPQSVAGGPLASDPAGLHPRSTLDLPWGVGGGEADLHVKKHSWRFWCLIRLESPEHSIKTLPLKYSLTCICFMANQPAVSNTDTKGKSLWRKMKAGQ